MENILIIGAGLMGSGIAQVCAQAGLHVRLTGLSAAGLERAMKRISWSLGKLVEKKALAEDARTILKRISVADGPEEEARASLLIEAVYENMEVKKEVFAKMDRICPENTLFASNTSAIPITELASATSRPDRFLGLHFFSPVPMMQAVEVVRGVSTSDETFNKAIAFVKKIGKEPIAVHRDVPGFIINRVNLPSTMEAIRLVEQGVATPEDVDKGLRLALGRPMGIFETGDMVGLDVTYGTLMAMYKETGDPRWFPPLLLRRKVKAGHLGKKTGRGWYEYNPDGTRKS